ncbi:MAG: hypothetical protein FWC79_00765 [Oscillospiraceae bacterium]|nr:hypothetical protein [Oscillospiraceae bacterium]
MEDNNGENMGNQGGPSGNFMDKVKPVLVKVKDLAIKYKIIVIAVVAVIVLAIVALAVIPRSPQRAVRNYLRAIENENARQLLRNMDLTGSAAVGMSINRRGNIDWSLFNDNLRDARRDSDIQEAIEEAREQLLDDGMEDMSDLRIENIEIRDVRRERDNRNINRVRVRVTVVYDGDRERLDFDFYTMRRGLNHFVIMDDGASFSLTPRTNPWDMDWDWDW